MMKRGWTILMFLFAALICAVALAAPRGPRPMPGFLPGRSTHPTNCEVICGVKMPPRMSQEMFRRYHQLHVDFIEARKKLYAEADEQWSESLTEKQRDALKRQSAEWESKIGAERAKAAARNAELVAITNRAAYIKKEWHEKRRSEYEFHPGLFWLGDPVFKETVTRAEKGKMVVHILYTRSEDGKERRHRYDPVNIKHKLEAVK